MASTLQKHTITAFYESRDYADRAAEKLRQSGVSASDVTISPENARDEYGLYGSDTANTKKTGFWASLEDMFGGTEHHDTYAEGVRRGHVLLTAHVADAQLERAIAILEEHGSIDLDEHEEADEGRQAPRGGLGGGPGRGHRGSLSISRAYQRTPSSRSATPRCSS